MKKAYVEYILPKRNINIIYGGTTTLTMPTGDTVQKERNGPGMMLL